MSATARLKTALERKAEARAAIDAIYAGAARDNRNTLNPSEKVEEQRALDQEAEAEADMERAAKAIETEQRADAFEARLGAAAYQPGNGQEQRTEGPSTPGEWLAYEFRTLTGASGVGQAWTPAEQSTAVLDFLAASSVFLASGVQVVRTTRDQITFPHLTSDAASAWVSPGAEITATDPGGETVTVTPEAVKALVALHNEVIADANPSVLDTVSRSLIRSLGLRYDLGAFEGSGTSPEPRGLKNVAGIQTVDMGTDGAALTNLDPFAEALGLLEEANATGQKAIVCHPRTWKAASILKEATGSNKALLQESAGSGSQGIVRSIYGVPVFLSSQISVTDTKGTATDASSVYVYDVEQVFAVLREDVRVELDRSRLFHQDTSEVRGVLRGSLAVPNPAAVCRIVGVLDA